MDKFLQEGELTALEQAALRLLIGALTAADLNNAAINAAIEEDAGASRLSLGLGSAATQNADAFDAAGSAAAAQSAAEATAAADATAKANAAEAAAIAACDPVGSAATAEANANLYTDTYSLSSTVAQTFTPTALLQLWQNLGVAVAADLAAANLALSPGEPYFDISLNRLNIATA